MAVYGIQLNQNVLATIQPEQHEKENMTQLSIFLFLKILGKLVATFLPELNISL